MNDVYVGYEKERIKSVQAIYIYTVNKRKQGKEKRERNEFAYKHMELLQSC